MASLKSSSLAYEKKDIFSLDKIPVDIDLKEDYVDKVAKKGRYLYFELNGWKYTLKSAYLEKLKQLLEMSPNTKSVKAKKSTTGDVYFVPVD